MNVVIVDYGASNLLSVCRAFQHLGVDVRIAARGREALGADRLVLPGVGAFGKAAVALKASGLDEAIREHVAKDRPFLGICLGMQLMLDESEEFGTHSGLGLIPGKVKAIPRENENGYRNKIPNVGWRNLQKPDERSWDDSLLSSEDEKSMYFVHSFMAVPASRQHCLAEISYNGLKICAAIRSGNAIGFQGHPEKSGEFGLKLLARFVTDSRI